MLGRVKTRAANAEHAPSVKIEARQGYPSNARAGAEGRGRVRLRELADPPHDLDGLTTGAPRGMNDDVLIDAVWKALYDGLNRYGDGDIHWVTEGEGREIARAAIEAAKPIIDAAVAAERAAIVALVEEVAATADKEFHSIAAGTRAAAIKARGTE